MIERAEALGEPTDDPLLLFSVLYGFWVGNRMAFKGDVACELAEQFHVLAQNQSATVPRMIGHMLMGISLVLVGDVADGRAPSRSRDCAVRSRRASSRWRLDLATTSG